MKYATIGIFAANPVVKIVEGGEVDCRVAMFFEHNGEKYILQTKNSYENYTCTLQILQSCTLICEEQIKGLQFFLSPGVEVECHDIFLKPYTEHRVNGKVVMGQYGKVKFDPSCKFTRSENTSGGSFSSSDASKVTHNFVVQFFINIMLKLNHFLE